MITAVGVLATGATMSFFFDVETSTGNTFTANDLDLKVDNTAHYNGCVCDEETWTCEPWADVAVDEDQGSRKDGSDVLANRSDMGTALGAAETSGANSDSPVITGSFYALGFGGSIIVKFNNVVSDGSGDDLKIFEVTGGAYPDESAEVAVSQDGENFVVLGTATRDRSFDLDSVDLPWIMFVKITDTSDIGLFPNDADGFDLDAIEALHCACASEPLENESCSNTWELTDLGPTHKFFDYTDIKPGDNGENTVSLHITGGNAWGRIAVDIVENEDGTCVEPEEDAEGDACEDGEGELGENLNFRMWLDSGITAGFQGKGNDIGEGDNIKQDVETLFFEPGSIDADGESWDITDVILQAYAANNNAVAPGITDDGHMSSEITYYFGIGWELPHDTGDEAQTDIFTSDITFEVEQYENNPAGFDEG